MVSCKALACALPATLGVPLARLHVPDLKAEMIARGIVAQISDMTIWRWLSEDAIRPWRHRSWIFPRDPDFEAKAGPVLDLYARRWRRKPLGPRDFVISADEKTSIQARVRCHRSAPPGPGKDMRVEHEYDRAGALAYLAAWDVHAPRCSGGASKKPASSRSVGRAGHDHGAVRVRSARVLGRRQRFVAPRPEKRRPSPR